MNRNVESHFSELPSIDIERSIFDHSHTHKTSWNCAELIPFYIDEVLPGDTFNVSTSFVARLQTLLNPIMDNVYLDYYYFFVRAQNTWTHWKEFMGENNDSAWIPQNEYSVPKINSPENGWSTGTIADYFGIPVGVEFSTADGSDKLAPIALPFRAYAQICQEWFRDQNLSDPLNIPLGDSNQTGSNGSSYINDVANGGKPFLVAKYHDYFTSCLPSPQKGNAVSFGANPIASISGNLPVYTKSDNIPEAYLKDNHYLNIVNGVNGNTYTTNKGLGTYYLSGDDAHSVMNRYGSTTSNPDDGYPIPANLWTDLSGATLSVSGVSFTINELRLAFQLQKFYEKWSRAGSRYRETLRYMFGCTPEDQMIYIPEYLGGHRVPIQIHQIVNQASSSGEYLGDVGAMSNTASVEDDFIKSFSCHGWIIGVACVRYDHSYPQGLSKLWTHDDRFSYYFPVFANIGEQPVYTYEIDATQYAGKNRTDVFGYQEAWASPYRYSPDRVSGEMRPGISNSLASWHLSDYYQAQPELSDSWIREDKTNIDRVLAVTSSVSNQIFADFYIKATVTRAMPMYSIPGLIDHH